MQDRTGTDMNMYKKNLQRVRRIRLMLRRQHDGRVRKQKEFITSASHELKTPLTVIMADTDILQMDDEDNEWVHDIRVQADRLTGMTNSLVSLARLDERGENINRIEFPISDVAQDIAGSYKAMEISCLN